MNAPGVVSQHRSGTAPSRSRGKCCSTTTGRSRRVSAPDCLTTVEQSNGRAAPSQRGEPFWWRGRSLLRRTSSEHVVDHSAHACFARRSTSAPSGARDARASSQAATWSRTTTAAAGTGEAGAMSLPSAPKPHPGTSRREVSSPHERRSRAAWRSIPRGHDLWKERRESGRRGSQECRFFVGAEVSSWC